MMNLRNTLATSAATIALAAASTAHAGDYYVSLFGGISTFDDEIPFAASTYNPGFAIPMHPTGRKTAASGLLYFTTGTGSSFTSRNNGYYRVIGNFSTALAKYGQSHFSWEDDFDSGFVVGAAFGANVGNGFRTEVELAYRAADVSCGGRVSRSFNGTIRKSVYIPTATNYVYWYYNAGASGFTTGGGLPVTWTSATTAINIAAIPGYGPIGLPPFYIPLAASAQGNLTSGGDASVWSLMANIWLDIDLFGLNPDGVTTFIGGGIGAAQLDLNYQASAGTFLGGTVSYSLDDSAMGFAYQLGAGIGFDMGNGMMLSAQYRWFGTSDVDLGNTDMRVESHNAIISLSVPLGNLSM